MGEKRSKWLDHLKAAERPDLKLSAYAPNHQVEVRRLYEAKRKRPQQAASNWAIVRVKPGSPGQITPKARVAMQARLGNGVVLSWTDDQRSADAPCGVLRRPVAFSTSTPDSCRTAWRSIRCSTKFVINEPHNRLRIIFYKVSQRGGSKKPESVTPTRPEFIPAEFINS